MVNFLQGEFVKSDIIVHILLCFGKTKAQLRKDAILENSFAEVAKVSLVKLLPIGEILRDFSGNATCVGGRL